MVTNYILNAINQIWNSECNSRVATHIFKAKHPDVFDKLMLMYPTVQQCSARAWLYLNQKSEPPTCLCGKSLKWLDFSRGYTKFCSTKCMANSVDVKIKKQATCINKYGQTHFSKTDEYHSKFKNTLLEKYGVTNPGQIPDIKLTRSRTKSMTYIKNLITQYQDKYTPLFDVEHFNGVHEASNWRCLSCNNDFIQPNLAYLELSCSRCYPKTQPGQSKLEINFYEKLKKIDNNVEIKNRSILNGKEIDIFFPDKNVGIEICGSYWHSDRFLNKQYHQDKMIQCESKGVKLLTLFDFDIVQSPNIIRNMIVTALNLESYSRIPARKCQIVNLEYSEAKKFIDTYHIRGYSKSKYHYGLKYQDELVAVSSWSNLRYDRKNPGLELIRLCSSISINGLLGKFTKFVYNLHAPAAIWSYVDLRYGNGRSYEASGYKLIKTTSPGYWYVDHAGKCWHRSSFTKRNLVEKYKQDINKTEFQIMDELKYHRIWDCGHRLYKWG